MTVQPDLRALAEKAKDERWWLWDDEPTSDFDSTLDFAHAATPRTILALLDRVARLQAVADAARKLRDAPGGAPAVTAYNELTAALAALGEQQETR